LLLFDRVFSEPLGRNFNPQFLQGIDIRLKLFFICPLEMVVGTRWNPVLTHYSCC